MRLLLYNIRYAVGGGASMRMPIPGAGYVLGNQAVLPELTARDPHELAKLHETRNMIHVAEMFLRASLTRTESRGSHCRAEHPELDNQRWLSWINLRKGEEGEMLVEREPVPLDRYPIQPRSKERAA